MLFLEAFIKFGAIGLLIAVGLLMLRDGRGTRIYRFSLLFIVAMIFILMTSGSESITLGQPWSIPLRFFDSLNPLFIWLLGMSMFDDGFEMGVQEWLVSLSFSALTLYSRASYLGFDVYWIDAIGYSVSVFSFVLMLHLCIKAITGHKEDLIERRRRVRIWFVIAVAAVMIAAIVAERTAEFFGMYQQHTIWVTHFFTFVLVLWSILWLTRLHPEMLAFAKNSDNVNKALALSASDKLAYDRLLMVMKEQRIHTNHGLAIGDLAEEVKMPAHQLRKLINQTMGYRNFSSFLNNYRLADVKNSLADPANSRTPILTLALDAGFSSLAPFNRAFKASEGITPTDFRAKKLAAFGENRA